MKALLFVITAALLMSGCASAPQVQPVGSNSYMILGESEFGYTDMVNDMYAKAAVTCSMEGKELRILSTEGGYGSTGFASKKRAFSLNFHCL